MKFRPRIELLFALSLLVPIVLFLIGNLVDSKVWRRAGGYSMVPFVLLITGAFFANLLSNIRGGPGRNAERRRERLGAVLSGLGEGFCLWFTRADGTRGAVRSSRDGFTVESEGVTQSKTHDDLLELLVSEARSVHTVREER